MTENEFNAKISDCLKRLSPKVHYVKASDKFTVGIPDFLLWKNGTSAGLESKFISEWPGPNVKLLSHPFTGSQITFLESLSLTKNRAFGTVGVGTDRSAYVFNWVQIPPDGNWKTSQFQCMDFKKFPFAKMDEMVDWIFSESI